MQGFDPKIRSYPDFLMSVMRDLWEERRFADRLPECLHPQVVQRGADGIVFGPAGVAGAMLPWLAAMPDLRLLGEDVIASGSDTLGWLGSHRGVIQGRHGGGGFWGGPTGRAVQLRVMTDAYGKGGAISDLWQVADTGAVMAALGIAPREWAAERLPLLDPETQPFRPSVDTQGPYTGTGNDNQWGAVFADLLEQVMSGGFSAIPAQYDRACALAYPDGVAATGHDAAEAFWLGLRASLPSAEFTVHHRIGLEDPLLPPRAALRWSLTGPHDGWGRFGAPTGASVHVMGISHAEFGPWGLRREWTVIDSAAVWLQIAGGAG